MNRPPITSPRELVQAMNRRRSGDYDVDPWGADPDWLDIFSTVAPMLRVRIEGSDRLPASGGALLVTNRRIGIGEPIALAVGIRRETGRLARPVGVPDGRMLSPLVRRFGMIRSSASEIRSVLAAGNLVVVGLTASLRREAGTVASDLLAPALDLALPVFPVATVGGELTGSWRVHIGAAIAAPSSVRRTPLAAAELADRARAGVQMLLEDEFPSRLGGA
jgi:hypothetical protein